jgi:hypothetical protein
MLFKIIAFKWTIRKILNMLTVHIEGIRHPFICLLDTLFCVSVPLIFKNKYNFLFVLCLNLSQPSVNKPKK